MSVLNEDYRRSEDWLRFRKHWLRKYQPMDNGCYLCGICGRWVVQSEVTLDHIEPRTMENMFQASNIQPAHGYCNYRKGSQRLKPVVSKDTYDYLYYLSNM